MLNLTDISKIPQSGYIYFMAEWNQESVDLLVQLKKLKNEIHVVDLEASEDIADHFSVAEVPKMIEVKNQKMV